MEYNIHQLAKISGVSTRTLRYYDQIALLRPAGISPGGYRIYRQKEVDILQQILFYRALGVPLKEIKKILEAPNYNAEQALRSHLNALLIERDRINRLIENVSRTIRASKGEIIMQDYEKFEGFKQQLITDNDASYGKEIRQKYGSRAVDASYQKIRGMDEARWQHAESLRTEYEKLLREAILQGDPTGEPAQRACDLHRQWICMFWKEGAYSKETHKGLAELYLSDERFTAYYEQIAAGCTEFFCTAIRFYCEK